MSLRQKLAWFNHSRSAIEAEARANGGILSRGDIWRKDYYTNPYLARISNDDLVQRVSDVFHNQVDLDDQGRITAMPMMYNNAWILQRWAHVLEEVSGRGCLTGEMLSAANAPLNRYFENGVPQGVLLFQGHPKSKSKALVKYSKSEFIEKMYKYGDIRVSPASFYASGSLLNAQQDLEVQRSFTIPTGVWFDKGYSFLDVEGTKYDITHGDIEIAEDMQDYFLFSMCREVDHRLPTDFEADAALVVHDTKKFQRLLFDALREKLKGWEMKNGEVSYYDPYTDFKRYRVLEMTKHFKFYYQKEFRLVARPRVVQATSLEPLFIRLGSLEDISTPYFLSR